MFRNVELSNFWKESEYAKKQHVCEPLTDELVADIESELGYKLPESYLFLMQTQNGGIPKNTCVATNTSTSWSEDHIAITSIFGISRKKSWSLCGSLGSQFKIDQWKYPDIGVYICDCPSAGHDMVALDYRNCGRSGEPQVVHVDQEADYKITPLAANFEEFIESLKHEDEYAIEDEFDDDQ